MRLATPATATALPMNAPAFAYGWPTTAAPTMRPVPTRRPVPTPMQSMPAARTAPRPTQSSKQTGTMRALLCFFAFWVVASFGFVMLFVDRLGA